MDRFEEFIRNILPHIDTFHPTYREAIASMVNAGGKRFRPRLMLCIVEAYEPLMVESAMSAAAAIEIFHTYSLIHDDLPSMDNADLRRGHPTIHKKYDEALAILAGDALNTYAFELLSTAPFRSDVKVELIKILAKNGGYGGMVLGQAIDLFFENKNLTIEQVVELHINKTAKLIAASLEMGAVIVGLERKIRKELYDFGIDLGILFQVQDDILDATQSSEKAGKPTGHDGDKNSFVSLLGLNDSILYADRLADRLFSRFGDFDDPVKSTLSDLVENYLYRHR